MSRSVCLRILHLGIVAALSVPAVAFSHGPNHHTGKPVEGEVLTAGADSFEMKTAEGNVTVSITGKTEFRSWDGPRRKEELTPGMQVSVYGTRLPRAQFEASAVVLGVVAPSEPEVSPSEDSGPPATPSADPHREH